LWLDRWTGWALDDRGCRLTIVGVGFHADPHDPKARPQCHLDRSGEIFVFSIRSGGRLCPHDPKVMTPILLLDLR